MNETALAPQDVVMLQRDDLQKLIDALAEAGYRVIGPTLRDGAIVYETISKLQDLPVGWTDEQEAGSYRLKKRDDSALFGYAVGPHSWKRFLFPPVERLWQARRNGESLKVVPNKEDRQRLAFLGVRACELGAIAVQDKVFMGGPYVNPSYQKRRENTFIIALNCGMAGKTCFCVSMKCGPKATTGFDLALTELSGPDRHEFVVEIGTPQGAEILRDIPCTKADDKDIQKAQEVSDLTSRQMGRMMDTQGIKDLLYINLDHSEWEAVAKRCLTCANCTLVCPTCFCHTVEDTTDLTGEHAERWRKWDSCFTMDFSYIHGGSVRNSTQARYRQWMTHKLATWIDQFGCSGCVGCGRCITWCPVGIDITEEVRAIQETSAAAQSAAVE